MVAGRNAGIRTKNVRLHAVNPRERTLRVAKTACSENFGQAHRNTLTGKNMNIEDVYDKADAKGISLSMVRSRFHTHITASDGYTILSKTLLKKDIKGAATNLVAEEYLRMINIITEDIEC